MSLFKLRSERQSLFFDHLATKIINAKEKKRFGVQKPRQFNRFQSPCGLYMNHINMLVYGEMVCQLMNFG